MLPVPAKYIVTSPTRCKLKQGSFGRPIRLSTWTHSARGSCWDSTIVTPARGRRLQEWKSRNTGVADPTAYLRSREVVAHRRRKVCGPSTGVHESCLQRITESHQLIEHRNDAMLCR